MKLRVALLQIFVVKALISDDRGKNCVYKSFMAVYIDHKYAFFSMSHV
jgi:hypothetical protein